PVGDIGDATANLTMRRDERLERAGIDIADKDARAGGGKRFRDGRTNAGRAGGHDDALIFTREEHVDLLLVEFELPFKWRVGMDPRLSSLEARDPSSSWPSP